MNFRIAATFGPQGALMFIVAGCASQQPYTSPDIQPTEVAILAKGYYWDSKKDPHHFSDTEIKTLFERAPLISEGDGEKTELYASQLAWALAAAGDGHFADLLAQQPRDIQIKVIRFIDGMWSFYKLHYPATEALAK